MKIGVNNYYTKPTFTSDEHLEAIRRENERQRQAEEKRQRELEIQRQIEVKRRQEEQRLKSEVNQMNKSLNEAILYKGLSDPLCDNMAAFMLNFSCSTLLDSEHNLKEFYGTEEQALELRKNLSPECQKNSIEMRNDLLKLKISQDPVFGLITVNRLKEYMPEEGILGDEQYSLIADSAKFACTTLVKQSNYDNFDDDEKGSIRELINIAETTNGLNFGDDFDKKLLKLIDSVNKKTLSELNESEHTKTYIPPVEVKYRKQNEERERERSHNS